MKQIALFCTTNDNELESQVNTWIANTSLDYDVLDIKYCPTEHPDAMRTFHNICIVYEDGVLK